VNQANSNSKSSSSFSGNFASTESVRNSGFSSSRSTVGSAKSEYLAQVLSRIDGCTKLVKEELSAYQSADPGENASPRTDYLLSVVIPVFNEINTIGRILSRVAALPLNLELVIIDDFSTDGTREVLQKLVGMPNVNIILQDENQGKGAALRTGFMHVQGDLVVVQDADLEYDPRDIPRLIQPLLRNEADVVYGSRFIGDEQQDESWVHRTGNAILTGASNLFSGLKLTDMETCYKAFNREVIQAIRIEQDRFGIEPEITAKLARRGYRFTEVPISYDSRGYDEGKKIGVKDLINAIYCIGRYGVSD
jgi:glycosyltransferase involved in cell wall biosynthesis